MKRAFTLIEVNLAMLIMAGGILSIVGLYAFGFRENAQSREDVASAAVADAVMSPLVMALSATNNVWSTFGNNEWTYPQDGWKSYLNGSSYKVTQDPMSQASSAFAGAMGKCSTTEKNSSFPSTEVSSSGLTCALVVHHAKGSGVVSIALRAVQKNKYSALMSQPMYYTEVRFQGVDRQ